MAYRFSVTVDEEAYKKITLISQREGQSQAATIRSLIQESLSLHVSEDNLDFITDIISTQIKAALAPYMERMIKLNAKACIQAGTAAYLTAETLSQFVPLQQQQDFYEAYEKARKKAVADIKSKD